jgi:hypothetical protein
MHITGQKFFLSTVVETKDQGPMIVNTPGYTGPGISVVGNRDPPIIHQRITVPLFP